MLHNAKRGMEKKGNEKESNVAYSTKTMYKIKL
jgi:hypothetical protein